MGLKTRQKENQEEKQKEKKKGRSRKKDTVVSFGASASPMSASARASIYKQENSVLQIAAAAGCLFLGIAVIGGGAYAWMGKKYDNVFFPRTIINGINASNRTPEEVKEMIVGQIAGYSLTLETRQGTQEVINGSDVELRSEYDGTLERLLDEQEPWKWGISAMGEKNYTIETMIQYDETLLKQAVEQLDCMQAGAGQAPKDASLSEYIKGVGYQIIPEELGTLLNRERMLAGVSDAVLRLQPTLDLEEIDAYEKPEITVDDPALPKKRNLWNQYVDTTVTYQFGNQKEVLDGSLIHQWLSDDGQGGVLLEKEQVEEYVRELALKYNTVYEPKTLKTSYGKEVTITGPYGWRIDQNEEVQNLMEILQSGKSQTREPIYSRTANSHDGADYGDTYVEINLTAQHLYFYKNGELLVESDFVSGNPSKGWETPVGAYPLTYKQRNATLRGETYETPVSYWMPFNGNVGMHDASWRSSFGGEIYKNNGSHGCINLPPSAAKIIFENISDGTPVLCYQLEGTEGGKSVKPTETQPVETTAAETKPALPEPTVSQPVETAPAQTTAPQPVETAPAQTEAPQPAETEPAQTEAAPAPRPADAPTEAAPAPRPADAPADTAPVSQPAAAAPSPMAPVVGPAGEEVKPSAGVVSGPGQ